MRLCNDKHIHNAHQDLKATTLEATTSKATTSGATTSKVTSKSINKQEHIVYQWVSGAAESNPKISSDELKCFVVILILSGYDVKPGKRFYWDSGVVKGNPLVKNSMRRNRFEQIKQFFHLTDNNQIDKNDKAWKVRLLMKKLKGTFNQHYVPDENINYDESMVEYSGRHNCKQFITGKPIRFGFKRGHSIPKEDI
ncbi:hypothetical protein JTB14_022944 [Gonioctena quinquepunctata]|nr:hypothetical protein JTB14_022944 [Gonioctena quinquepunctata]